MSKAEMALLPYYLGTFRMPCKVEMIYFIVMEDFWLYQWKSRQYDNHNMALMLIDVLYSRKMINDTTYRRIMQKYSYEYQFVKGETVA